MSKFVCGSFVCGSLLTVSMLPAIGTAQINVLWPGGQSEGFPPNVRTNTASIVPLGSQEYDVNITWNKRASSNQVHLSPNTGVTIRNVNFQFASDALAPGIFYLNGSTSDFTNRDIPSPTGVRGRITNLDSTKLMAIANWSQLGPTGGASVSNINDANLVGGVTGSLDASATTSSSTSPADGGVIGIVDIGSPSQPRTLSTPISSNFIRQLTVWGSD
jgi:hypothetical protein